MTAVQEDSPSKRIRWWPAVAVLLLDVVVLTWVWWFQDVIRQEKVVNTMLSQTLAAFLLLIWLLFLSRLRWKLRLTSFFVFLLLILGFIALFRFKEFSGDIVPMFEWRWRASRQRISNPVPPKNPEAMKEIDTTSRLRALNYPQFLGPNRNCKVDGLKLARDWQRHPPHELWRQAIGEGWSSFAVVDHFAVTQEQKGDQERVVCYDIKTGGIIWTHSDTARYETVLGGIGPRATPTINSGYVYTQGATGLLNCLDLKSGKRIWHKNILTDNHATPHAYGVSGSPLVLDSLVVVCPGGTPNRSLVAYHRLSGELVWASGSDRAGYSSPMVTTLAGVRQILIFNDAHVVAHRPTSGEILWQFPWLGETEKVAQPVILPGNKVLISSGYSVGSKLLQIKRGKNGVLSPTLLWESNRLKAKFTNLAYQDGYVYGLDDGILACLDISNGKRKWKRGRYGHGQLILVDDLLLILTESGDIALAEAKPDAYQELARIPAIKGKTWNNPAVAGPYLLVRNSREAACYELPIEN